MEKTGARLATDIINESVLERLHPLFGYVRKGVFSQKKALFAHKESGIRVNNYGLVSKYDYPFAKTNKNQFIVGVFGGSVAYDFAISAIYNEAKGNEGFIQSLKQIPQLKDK
ncbi:MAG: hypothetical protein F6K17_34765 [Okeania sp. SIO3C4]|nr:hypothetical protein [Okeania sp. SIO3C4]